VLERLGPVLVQVQADEECLVGKAKDKQGARVVVVVPEDTGDILGDCFVRRGAGCQGAVCQ
jgi:hypothetical protein